MAEEKKSGETKEKEFEDVDFGMIYKKERLFYRALSGYTYSLRDELRRLRKVPRVIKGKSLTMKKGPSISILISSHQGEDHPGSLCPLRRARSRRKIA